MSEMDTTYEEQTEPIEREAEETENDERVAFEDHDE